MKIIYYEDDDILLIELSKGKIIRDKSLSWNVNIGYTHDGIGGITILEARKAGYYPVQFDKVETHIA